MVLDIDYSDASLFETDWSTGVWNTDSFRRFGLYGGGMYPTLNQFEGTRDQGGRILSEAFALEPNTTYTLLMAILPGHEFLLVIWDPADPDQTLNYRGILNEKRDDLRWTFWFQVNTGLVRMDNFADIRFTGAK